MDTKLLDILCCPVSHTPLRLLKRDELARLNQAIRDGRIDTVTGEPVTSPLSNALITTDGKIIYRVEDDIPVLLGEEGIGTLQLEGSGQEPGQPAAQSA